MTVFQKYPCVRYHRDQAPEGRPIRSADEEEELGAGWVDTPAAFRPGYVRLTKDPPEGTPFESYVAPATPPIPYPAMRYSRTGETRVINSPVEEQDGWHDHPWTAAELGTLPASKPPGPSGPGTATAPPPPSVDDDQDETVMPLGTAETDGPQADALFSVTVAQVEQVLSDIRDPLELDAITAREQRNPRGPRKGVLNAIQARRELLVGAPLSGA